MNQFVLQQKMYSIVLNPAPFIKTLRDREISFLRRGVQFARVLLRENRKCKIARIHSRFFGFDCSSGCKFVARFYDTPEAPLSRVESTQTLLLCHYSLLDRSVEQEFTNSGQ